jgi:hypothetical protein
VEVVLEFMAGRMHQIIRTEHPDLGKLIAKKCAYVPRGL